MIIANLICYILVLLGAINWGLVGIFGLNLVTLLFGTIPILVTIFYVLILIAGVWLIISAITGNGNVAICSRKDNR